MITPVGVWSGTQSPVRGAVQVPCVGCCLRVLPIYSTILPGRHVRRLVCRSGLLARRGRFSEGRRCDRSVF